MDSESGKLRELIESRAKTYGSLAGVFTNGIERLPGASMVAWELRHILNLADTDECQKCHGNGCSACEGTYGLGMGRVPKRVEPAKPSEFPGTWQYRRDPRYVVTGAEHAPGGRWVVFTRPGGATAVLPYTTFVERYEAVGGADQYGPSSLDEHQRQKREELAARRREQGPALGDWKHDATGGTLTVLRHRGGGWYDVRRGDGTLVRDYAVSASLPSRGYRFTGRPEAWRHRQTRLAVEVRPWNGSWQVRSDVRSLVGKSHGVYSYLSRQELERYFEYIGSKVRRKERAGNAGSERRRGKAKI